MSPEPLDPGLIARLVRNALDEDHAFEDATTLATVSPRPTGTATLLDKEAGILAGMPVALEPFRQLDPEAELNAHVPESGAFTTGTVLAEVTGLVQGMLRAERVALNFLQRMSGVATLTNRFVSAVEGTHAVILDTRKTTPGLRDFEKYSVRCGGGTNHRRDLAAMAMVKDNHREALARMEQSLKDGVEAIRRRTPGVPVEIEIDSLEQLDAALAANPEWILLDNMDTLAMREAVQRVAGRAKLEASGGVSLTTVRAIAATGVDAISVGALTHSARALDISLDLAF